MTVKEAIKMQEAIKAGLKETGKDHPYRDALIPLMKESCDMAIKALKAQDMTLYMNLPEVSAEEIITSPLLTKKWKSRMEKLQ